MSSSTLPATGHTTVPAPAHFRAVVTADGSITTSWDAVPGATYTLKEKNKSPNGVEGATGITATTSVRHPHGHGVYEYYVVAVKNGVESAESNHVTVDLSDGHTPPSTSTSPAQTGGSPAKILQIGGDGGHWELGSGARKEDMDDLRSTAGADGSVDGNGMLTIAEDGLVQALAPYFTPAPGGTAVQFQSFMVGAIRPPDGHGHGSKYTRSELRELDSHGAKRTWNGKDGTHILSGTTAVMHMPPKSRKICVAQIHGSVSDTLELRVESEDDGTATGGFRWIAKLSNGNEHGPASATPTVKDDYTLGDEVDWEIKVADSGTVTVTIDGKAHVVGKAALSEQFFKTGCYTQTNHNDSGNPEDEFEAITLRNLRLSHDN